MLVFLESFIQKILSSQNGVILLVAVLLLLFFMTGIIIGLTVQRLRDMSVIRREREDAVSRSRAVLCGLAGEQLAPLLPHFPCNAGDVRFIGKPVDYVAFPGMAEGGEVKDIVFIEVKSGNAGLSKREREIKAAVKARRVYWQEYRLP